jgi:hypothetical protein
VPVPAPRRRLERLVALALAVQLTVGVVAALRLQPTSGRPVPDTRTRAANARNLVPGRTSQVEALLAARATALLQRDRQAFLATVDPHATTFLARQGVVFDNLAGVPLASWHYDVDPTQQRPHTTVLDTLRGTWWAPDVTLRYALVGYDRSPTLQPQGLTFVQRLGHWYVAADDDFTTSPTARELWDGGPVQVGRGTSCLVLGHPRSARLIRSLTGECDQAVPRVTAVWGTGWSRKVVLLVPDTTAELARLVPDAGDLSQIAALATAELVSPGSGYHPVGDRVLVNPHTFSSLGPLGRRVVLTHEVTHVASRRSTGLQLSTWFVEGLADYVGYHGVQVPLALAAEELRGDVREGRVPARLPLDGDFDGARKDLAQTYEMSWLAVVLMAQRYGQAAMLRVYRDTGADTRTGALDRAMRKDLHVTLSAFTRTWRADLRARLS